MGMQSHTQANGMIRPCCGDLRNLKLSSERPGGITVRTCQVCHRKHYQMRAEPGVIGTRGTPLGRPGR
jgi:hypothetical protein